MKKVRVAVIGYGHLGKWHCQKVEAHREVAELKYIVEKSSQGQEAARNSHPGVQVVADLAAVVNEIDAAFVVTPTSTHFEIVKFLLEKNKHVFCEKPLCSNDIEAASLKEIAEGKNLVIQVGHSERFHEAWEHLREKFFSLPAPYSIRINRVAPFKGRATDVDVVQDLAIHDLDLILYLFKNQPLTLSARGFKIRTDKWDHASIHLQLENECEALVVVGRNATKEVRDLEVTSKEGMISVDLFTNKILQAPNTKFSDDSFVKEEPYQKRDHLLLEHRHFYESVLNQKPAVIGLEAGIDAVRLVDAALRALATQSSLPVKLG